MVPEPSPQPRREEPLSKPTLRPALEPLQKLSDILVPIFAGGVERTVIAFRDATLELMPEVERRLGGDFEVLRRKLIKELSRLGCEPEDEETRLEMTCTHVNVLELVRDGDKITHLHCEFVGSEEARLNENIEINSCPPGCEGVGGSFMLLEIERGAVRVGLYHVTEEGPDPIERFLDEFKELRSPNS